jgi:hypothetical protein
MGVSPNASVVRKHVCDFNRFEGLNPVQPGKRLVLRCSGPSALWLLERARIELTLEVGSQEVNEPPVHARHRRQCPLGFSGRQGGTG